MKIELMLAALAVAVIVAALAYGGKPLFAAFEDQLYGLAMKHAKFSGAIAFAAPDDGAIHQIKTLIDGQGDLIKKQGENQAALQVALDNEAKRSKSEVDAVVAKINEEFASLKKQYDTIEKKAARPEAGGVILTPEHAEYKAAFNLFLRKGRDEGLAALQRKAMNTTSDTDGGYLVLPEMDMVIDRIAQTMSAMYRLADVRTIGTAKYEKLVKTAGMAMRRTAEGATGGETTEPKFAKIGIEVFPAEVEPWINNETLEDAFINLETDLADEAAIGFVEGSGAEFITGDGVGKARGITAYNNVANSAYAWGSVGYILSGKAGAFASVAPSDKLIDLQHSLKAQYRPGATFLMNDATLGKARQMKDASGAYYLWQPDTTAGFGGRFLGSPVEIDDNFAVMAANSYSLAFGNFKRGYAIVNRSGTVLIRDNVTTKGVTKFNFRRRFGGGITNFEAIKLMKFATS